MFLGSIPAHARSIVREYVSTWTCRDVQVGCSGNLTVERILHDAGRFTIHGNDVSIYTCCLGSYFAGQPFRLDIQPKHRDPDDLGWLEPYIKEPVGALATLMLGTKMLEAWKKRDKTYYGRLYGGYRSQWPQLFEATVQKLSAVTMHLGSFYVGGVLEMMDDLPPDRGFISYPPFWNNGYENVYQSQGLLDAFDWDAPQYRTMGQGEIDELMGKIMDRKHWIVGAAVPLPQYETHLKAITQTTSRAMPIHIYASDGPCRVALPDQSLLPVGVDRLLPGDSLGNELRIIPLQWPQFATLRSQYLNARIRPGSGTIAFAVVVDTKIVGACAFSPPNGMIGSSGVLDEPSVYMLSDFAVGPTSYKHLSKLILMAALSVEAKLLFERMIKRRVHSIATTAFSDRPMSMKYRGLFTLLNRAPYKDEHIDGYKINYGANAGQWTLADAYATWTKKHGGQRVNS